MTWIVDPGTEAFATARSEFEIADNGESTTERCEEFNVWCKKWMKKKHWQRMKNTIRATRKRQSDRYGVTTMTTVSMSKHASTILKKEAKKEGLSISSFILRKIVNI